MFFIKGNLLSTKAEAELVAFRLGFFWFIFFPQFPGKLFTGTTGYHIFGNVRQGFLQAASLNAPGRLFTVALVAGHRFAAFRVYYGSTLRASVNTSPAANAGILIGYNSPIF
jgi:hypothetical protein